MQTSEVSKCRASGFGLYWAGKGETVRGSKESRSIQSAMSQGQKGGGGVERDLKQSKFLEGTGPRWR